MRSSSEPGDPSDAALTWAGEMRRADDTEVAERIEVESAATSWVSLLAPAGMVDVVSDDGAHHRGKVAASGECWVLIEAEVDDRLVMLDRVVSVVGLGPAASRPRVVLGPGSVFRRWSQMRQSVSVRLSDGSQLHGQVAAVYADAIEVVTDGQSRRVVLPLGGITWVSAERTPL